MFLPYMDVAVILFNSAEPFELIGNLKSGGNCSSSFRKDIQILTILYMYIAVLLL